MSRQDDQPWVAHAHEYHEDEIGGAIGMGRLGILGRTPFFQILQTRFVAMMAVGNKDRLGPQKPRKPADELLIRQRPESMDYAQMIGRFEGWRFSDGRFENSAHFVCGVRKKAEDRAEVHPGRSEQIQTIRLGPGQRFLMWKNLPLAKWLQSYSN